MSELDSEPTQETRDPQLSAVAIALLRGVVYRDEGAAGSRLWHDLLALQHQVRDYFAVLGLILVLDESEGLAFLRSLPADEQDVEVPRLIARRPLTFGVSLLLTLLRKKLAEFDAGSHDGDTRLVLNREDMADLMRIFLPDSSDEVKLLGRLDTDIERVVKLGFLRKMRRSGSGSGTYEVRRILKMFVDAQWLAEFDARLGEYRAELQPEALASKQAVADE